MATDSSFESLWAALHALRDNVRALGLTVAQDHPNVPAVPEPVRRMADDVDDLLGMLHEAIAAVAPSVEAVLQAHDSHSAARGLRDCHNRLIALGRASSTGPASPERLDDLAAVAADRDVRWQRWRASVLDGLRGYERTLWDAHAAALTCWDDLSSCLQAQPAPAGADASRSSTPVVPTRARCTHSEED